MIIMNEEEKTINIYLEISNNNKTKTHEENKYPINKFINAKTK